MELFVKDITRLTNGKLSGPESRKISYLLTDSRSFFIPEQTVFFAFSGPNHDGHSYIKQLYEKGVRCFVVSKPVPDHLFSNPPSLIRVNDTLAAFQRIGAYTRELFSSPVIGICGSNGKTIVKEWLTQALSVQYKVIRSPKSYNSQIGVPHSLWLLDPSFDYGIIEAGISRPGEMEKLERIIRPELGIITNIGEPHQENFESLQQKIEEKIKLFQNTQKILYCKDHTEIHEALTRKFSSAGHQLFSWSARSDADLQVLHTEMAKGYTKITVSFKNKTGILQIPYSDRASFENAMHVSLALLILGYSLHEVREALSRLEPVAMRLELKKGIHHCTLINDTYNSDLASLDIALNFLDQQSVHLKKTVILSDILQSGRKEKDLYKKVASMIAERKINRFIGIGKALHRHAGLFQKNGHFFISTEDFLNQFSRSQFRDEIILLKGARMFEFERISKQLESLVHKTQLEINLGAMIHNLNYFRKKLKPGTRIMVMVKAFGYGSGTHEIAGVLQHQGVDYLAVAYTDEGIALREEGIELPIMVMSPEPESLKTLIQYSLEPEIYSFSILKSMIRILRAEGITGYPVHIKFDTGMHRLGFREDELEELLLLTDENREINARSVFSHLAGSEDPKLDEFSRQQIQQFLQLKKKIEKKWPEVLFHMLNSAGIERFPEARFDMVRLGIGLHGFTASPKTSLQPVATFRSIIIQLKEVPAGSTIGYGRKGKAKTRKVVAVIPVGYADGLSRQLGNGKWYFNINGQKAPIIGEVCMDMCMADVSGLDVEEGMTVEIFGPLNPVGEMAGVLKTIPYEILTSVSGRVKRTYLFETQ